MKEITDRLEQVILGRYESDRYANYLRTMSKFHDYSLNNTILITIDVYKRQVKRTGSAENRSGKP